MLTRKITSIVVISALGFMAPAVQAEDKAPAAKPAATKPAAKTSEPIYGRQMMTREERQEYRAMMRAAKTDEECDAVRAEHHKKMQERAKEKGATLPAEPVRKGCGPARGKGGRGGMGMGGMGPGMGPGPGMRSQ